MGILEEHRSAIKALCKQYQVKALFVFGSSVKGNLQPSSDLDFVVDIDSVDPIIYADNYFNLKLHLQDLLSRRIDLLEEKALRNIQLKKEIDQTKVLLYAA